MSGHDVVTLNHERPQWLKRKISAGASYQQVLRTLQRGQLHTVCQEAKCPNSVECFSRGTATFLILGDRCTRNCRFCAVARGPVGPPDTMEPRKVAEAIQRLRLRFAVITSVTRDDLPDGGAELFAATIHEIRDWSPEVRVEVLVPDFKGSEEAIRTVVEAHPDVFSHNLETVPSLYRLVRPLADYKRSLDLLNFVRELDPNIPTKSGLMLGLGESPEELRQVLTDLLGVGCKILTLGQYLQASRELLPVRRFIPPDEFKHWREIALRMGFLEVASGSFVRSSYNAENIYNNLDQSHFKERVG